MIYSKILYNQKYYAVIELIYKNTKYPLLLDWVDFKPLKRLNKRWKYGESNLVSCSHTSGKLTKDVFIHVLIMALKNQTNNTQRKKESIEHLNRIGLDNRRDNIIYDSLNKKYNKNIKKKKRTITFPEHSGIDPNELPTYVWYLKPDKTHGPRFMVKIKDLHWKTTSSKKLSLRYKLEESKKYLRDLKDTHLELFDEYSMNGDFTKYGKQLLKEYYEIITKAGFDNIEYEIKDNSTNKLLQEKINLVKIPLEKQLLKDLDITLNKNSRRRTINNLPPTFNMKSYELPIYSCYQPPNKKKGGYFIYNNPIKNKTWYSTSSTKVTINEKYDQLIKHIN
jgi:hypothetical protein